MNDKNIINNWNLYEKLQKREHYNKNYHDTLTDKMLNRLLRDGKKIQDNLYSAKIDIFRQEKTAEYRAQKNKEYILINENRIDVYNDIINIASIPDKLKRRYKLQDFTSKGKHLLTPKEKRELKAIFKT